MKPTGDIIRGIQVFRRKSTYHTLPSASRVQALFIVGLDPFSSRIARRFPWPAMVFNPHSQFRLMREQNTYSAMKSIVRERDFALQKSLNPNLGDFGTESRPSSTLVLRQMVP